MNQNSSTVLKDEKIYSSHEEVLKQWFEDIIGSGSNEEIDRKISNEIEVMNSGKIIDAKVVAITDEDVFVDVGYKSEGIIPLNEFRNIGDLKVGDMIDIFIEGLEDYDGKVKVSKSKANFIKLWDDIENLFESGQIIKAKILKRIKGGMLVDLMGVDAFLPGSQIDVRAVTNMDNWVNENIEVKIVKINKIRRNIVVSRRAIVEEHRNELRDKLLDEIDIGQTRKGIVKNVTDYGVFLDLGGADGLLHITDMSWGRINHPSEVVKMGQEIKVKVLGFDEKKERISLGLKQLEDHPWNYIDTKHNVGDVVKGRVVALTDYGAFIEIEKGIEGLIHVSEMSWDQSVSHPNKILKEGESVEAKILSIDKKEQKISLGIKQLGEDPWQRIEEKFPVDSRRKGIVCNITTFGAFVELEGGIDGLIHISDLSWTKKITHPSQIFKKGDEIEVLILGIDKAKRRISLGYKQLANDPWSSFESKYSQGTDIEGKVVRIMNKGLVVELDDEVEAIVPIKEISKKTIVKLQGLINEGDVIPLKVIEFDMENRKIVLSVISYFEGKSDAEYEAWWNKVSSGKNIVGLEDEKTDADAQSEA